MTQASNPSTEELPLVACETEANEAIGLFYAFVALLIGTGIGNYYGIL